MFYQYYEEIKDYNFAENEILVFGCHELGKHRSGYAQIALHSFGAKIGQGEGRQGQSYGIPTIGSDGEVLSISEIQNYIENFKVYAKNHKNLIFYMTEIGCGFANYSSSQIAPLFKDSPVNIKFPISFIHFVEDLIPFSINDIEQVWKMDETHIELPLDHGVVARMKFNDHEQLINKLNIWEKYSSVKQNSQYLKLDDSQFSQLHHCVEKYKKEEAALFEGLF